MKENKDRSVSRFALSMLLLFVLVISTGLALRQTKDREIKNEPRELINHLMSENRHMQPLELADMIIQEDPSLLMIDLRDPVAYDDFSLPGAVNITPDSLIRSSELQELWKNRALVLFDNDERLSNTTWVLAKQVGYQNILVLRGGLNGWFEQVLQTETALDPPSGQTSGQQSRRQAATLYFGVHQDLPDYVLKEDQKALAPKRTVAPKKEVTTTPKKKKKMPEGGC